MSKKPEIFGEANKIFKEIDFVHKNNKITICIVTCFNGYMIVETSYCQNSKKFDKDLGEQYSLEKAVIEYSKITAYLKDENEYRRTLN